MSNLSRPRFQHAERHGNGHRSRRRAPDGRSILFERSFRYDDTLPAYGTQHGVLRSPDAHVVHAPPLMWSEGLDRILSDVVREEGVDTQQLRAIQDRPAAWQRLSQREARPRKGARCPGRLLRRWPTASRARRHPSGWIPAPRRVRRDEAALGGPRSWRSSRAREPTSASPPRRSGSSRRSTRAYAATERIHLVSSFLASLLAGAHAASNPATHRG